MIEYEATTGSTEESEDVNGMMMMMPMFFTNSYKTTLWFKSWKSERVSTYLMMLFTVAVLGVLAEFLMTWRSVIANKKSHIYEELGDVSDTNRKRMEKALRFFEAFLYFICAALSYLLMLATMTFNTGLFVAVIAGLTIGHFLFGSMRSPNDDAVCQH